MSTANGSYGYAGQILKINLTDESITTIPTSTYSDTFIGGRSMGAAIYWDMVSPDINALDPENCIIWTCGPSCGVLGAGPSRVAISTKAPATTPEAYSLSTTGAGHWGAELRFAGYDGLVVTGKAKTPVYIHITDDDVVIRPADQLWGKGTRDTDNEIKRLWGTETRVCQIGPAGERLNLYASILTDFSHATGQGGFGAVMGSKNLKAIAVHGTGSIKVAEPKKLIDLFYNKVLLEGPNPNSGITEAISSPWQTHPLWPADPDFVAKYREGHSLEERWDPDSELGNLVLMKDDVIAGKATYKFGGCWSCPGGCHFSARYEDINYLTTPMNLCHQAHQLKAQHFSKNEKLWGAADYLWSALCIDYGMSVDIFGVCNEWVNDLMAAGCLTEEDFQLDYDWSIKDPNIWFDPQFIRDVVRKVAYKEGSEKFRHIADGPNKCLEWFAANDDRAVPIYNKFITQPYFNSADGKSNPNSGDPCTMLAMFTDYKFMHHPPVNKIKGGSLHLNIMPADEKAERLKAGVNYYSNRLFGEDDAFGFYEKPEENTYTGKAAPVIFLQNAELEMDSMSLCGWAGWPLYASAWSEDGIGSGGIGTEVYNAITGNDYYLEDQNARYGIAWTLMRAIHVREGRRKEHDLTVTKNPVFAKNLEKYSGGIDGFIEGIEEYYDARGWDPKTGIPRKSTLNSLGIGYVADQLERDYGIPLKD